MFQTSYGGTSRFRPPSGGRYHKESHPGTKQFTIIPARDGTGQNTSGVAGFLFDGSFYAKVRLRTPESLSTAVEWVRSRFTASETG
jgi:hypothetical protein